MKHRTILCLLLAAALLLAGCGPAPAPRSSTESTEASPSMVSLYDLRTAMTARAGALPAMTAVSSSDENAAELFGYLSDLDYEKVEGYFLAYAAEGEAFELAVVCLKDAAELPALEESLKAHLRNRVSLYENYSPEQTDRARGAELVSEGRYMALIMCDENRAVAEAFREGVR